MLWRATLLVLVFDDGGNLGRGFEAIKKKTGGVEKWKGNCERVHHSGSSSSWPHAPHPKNSSRPSFLTLCGVDCSLIREISRSLHKNSIFLNVGIWGSKRLEIGRYPPYLFY